MGWRMFLGVKEIETETYPAPICCDKGVIVAEFKTSAVRPLRVVVVYVLDVLPTGFVRAVKIFSIGKTELGFLNYEIATWNLFIDVVGGTESIRTAVLELDILPAVRVHDVTVTPGVAFKFELFADKNLRIHS